MTTVDSDTSISLPSNTPTHSPLLLSQHAKQIKPGSPCYVDAANLTDTEVDYCPDASTSRPREQRFSSDRFILRRPNLSRYTSWHDRFANDRDFEHLHHPHHHPYASGISLRSPHSSFPLYRGYMAHRSLLSGRSSLPSPAATSSSSETSSSWTCGRCTFIFAVILVLVVGLALLATFVYFTVAPGQVEYNSSSLIEEVDIFEETKGDENVEAELRSSSSQEYEIKLTTLHRQPEGDAHLTTTTTQKSLEEATRLEEQSPDSSTHTEEPQRETESSSNILTEASADDEHETHEDINRAESSTCEALGVQYCYQLLPYTATGKPNIITGPRQNNGDSSKAGMLERLLVDTSAMFRSCYRQSEQLMCMLVHPKCSTGPLINVCREDCQDFVNKCTDMLNNIGISPLCQLLPREKDDEECMRISTNESYSPIDTEYPQLPGIMETLHLMLSETPNLLISTQKMPDRIRIPTESVTHYEAEPISDDTPKENTSTYENIVTSEFSSVVTDPTVIYSIKNEDLDEEVTEQMSSIEDQFLELDISRSDQTAKPKIKTLSGVFAGVVSNSKTEANTEESEKTPTQPLPAEEVSATRRITKIKWPVRKLKVKPTVEFELKTETTKEDVEESTSEQQENSTTEVETEPTTTRFRKPKPNRFTTRRLTIRRNRILQSNRRRTNTALTTPDPSSTEPLSTSKVEKVSTNRHRYRPRVIQRGPFRIGNRLSLRKRPTDRNRVRLFPPPVNGQSRTKFEENESDESRDSSSGAEYSQQKDDVHLGKKIQVVDDDKNARVIDGVKIDSDEIVSQESGSNEKYAILGSKTREKNVVESSKHRESSVNVLKIKNRPSGENRGTEISDQDVNHNRTSCRGIYLRICKPLLAYGQTSYPNMFLHQGERQLRAFRRTFRRGIQELKKCHKDGVTLACAMLQPKCTQDKAQINLCPALCNEVKTSCSRALRAMYLYPNCDTDINKSSCLTMDDTVASKTGSTTNGIGESTTKVPVVQTEHNIRKKLSELLTPTKAMPAKAKEDEHKPKQPVPISVLIPYTIPDRHKESIKSPSSQSNGEQSSDQNNNDRKKAIRDKEIIEEVLISSESQEKGAISEVSNMKKIRQNGPTREPKIESPRVGAIIVPTTDRFLSSDFVTRFPFPKIDENRRKKRPTEKERLVGEQSREVKVLYPQLIRPNRFKKPKLTAFIRPIQSPVFVDAGVGFGQRVSRRKNYKEIVARPGVMAKSGEPFNEGFLPEVPKASGLSLKDFTDRSLPALTSYAAQPIDLNPIRAALLNHQLQVTSEAPKSSLVYATLKPIVPITTPKQETTSQDKDNRIESMESYGSIEELALEDPIAIPTEQSLVKVDPSTDIITESKADEIVSDDRSPEYQAQHITLVDFQNTHGRSRESLTEIQNNAISYTVTEREEVPCSNSTFKCQDGNCIRNEQLCDEIEDCAGGEDEDNCAYLSPEPRYNGNITPRSTTKGFLIIRQQGKWFPVCADLWDQKFASKFCKRLDFRYGGESKFRTINDSSEFVYYHEVFGSPVQTPTCHKNEIVYLECVAHMACPTLMTDHHPKRICDGIPDCRDFSDEINCHPCNYESDFLCMKSQTCIKKDQVCDGVNHCKHGEDEDSCLTLSSSGKLRGEFTQVPLPVESTGYLLVKRNNRWHHVCSDSWIPSLTRSVCNHLSFKNMKEVDSRRALDETSGIALSKFSKRVSSRFGSSPLHTRFVPVSSNSSTNCSVVHISCEELACGEIPPSQSQSSEESWPWFGALNADGMFKCPAIIFDKYWAITSPQCIENSKEEYLVVRTGTNRLQHYNPYEQVAQVNYISMYNNSMANVALLHFFRPIFYTGSTWPICVKKWTYYSELNDCVVLGWDHNHDKNHETDYMHRRVTITDVQNCAPTDDSNNTICVRYDEELLNQPYQNDEVTALMCKVASAWTLVGIQLPSDDSDGQKEFSLFTDVQRYKPWMNAVQDDVETHGISISENRIKQCKNEGFMCLHGNCVNKKHVCDGRVDCLDESDELSCYNKS